MDFIVDDNPTRQRIIMLLKKAGQMTVAELSKAMGITPMAVRQHLMSLERKRIVEYETKKYGIGRPLFLYRLTDKADEIFPHAHTDFLMEVLRTIEGMDGREKVDDVFRKITESHLDDKKRSLRGIEDFTEKIIAFTEVLSKDGYLIELEEKDGAFELKQYNCLLSSVAREYPETCAMELDLYREVLGRDIARSSCQKEGAAACVYVIPKE
jgi:predicted ArsR family transcriptional regulator